KRALRKPCPECATPIEKISFLGGACYFCPQCQT
ncbi:MAG: endonuclease VIII, partial [Armatimonadetes bacterium]|nr:endonuclease VIII [Armatimonadota bacterium]